jgi:hypothetical protein
MALLGFGELKNLSWVSRASNKGSVKKARCAAFNTSTVYLHKDELWRRTKSGNRVKLNRSKVVRVAAANKAAGIRCAERLARPVVRR